MDDTPFEVLMKQAADIKFAQLAQDRRKYDSRIRWYRNSLFAKQDVMEVRKSEDFQKKLMFSIECKEVGNRLVHLLEYDLAVIEYERALSIWKWIESRIVDWKRQAIDDKDLIEKQYFPRTEEESKLIKEQYIANLANLTLCYLKIQKYTDCIEVCTDIIQSYDPQHSKAFYRRAQARIIPPSSGTSDYQLALQDLKQAYQLNPNNHTIAKEYVQLHQQLQQQYTKDLKSYQHFFTKYESLLIKEEDTAKRESDKQKEGVQEEGSSVNVKELQQMLTQITEAMTHHEDATHFHTLRQAAKQNELSGMEGVEGDNDDATEVEEEEEQQRQAQYIALRQKKELLEQVLANHQTNSKQHQQQQYGQKEIDFFHPSPAMIQEAKEQHDLDLTDVKVQSMLASLQSTHKQQQQRKEPAETVTVKEEEHNSDNEEKNGNDDAAIAMQETMNQMYIEEARQIVQRVLPSNKTIQQEHDATTTTTAAEGSETDALLGVEDKAPAEEEEEEVGIESYDVYARLLSHRMEHSFLPCVLGRQYVMKSWWIQTLSDCNDSEEHDPYTLSPTIHSRTFTSQDAALLYTIVSQQMIVDLVQCYQTFQCYQEAQEAVQEEAQVEVQTEEEVNANKQSKDHEIWSNQVFIILDMYFQTPKQFYTKHAEVILQAKNMKGKGKGKGKGGNEDEDEYDLMLRSNPFINKQQRSSSFFKNPSLLIGLIVFGVFVLRMLMQFLQTMETPTRQPVAGGAAYYMT